MEKSLLVQLTSAFLVSFSFAILTNSPKRTLLFCGINGMCGWCIYLLLLKFGFSQILAVFFGTLAISILSEIFARILKNPVPIFLIPGLIPLVPGAGTYNTMIALLKNQFNLAMHTGMKTLLLAGSIAVAIMLVTSFNWLLSSLRKK